MDSKPSKIPPTSTNKNRANLEFNMTNNVATNKSTPSPTSSSIKLRKSITLTNSNTPKKQSQSENTTNMTQQQTKNSMTNVNNMSSSSKNKTNNIMETNRNDENPSKSTPSRHFSKPKSIYVNDNFDDFYFQNEFNTNKLNETIVKSVKRDESQISPGTYSVGGGSNGSGGGGGGGGSGGSGGGGV